MPVEFLTDEQAEAYGTFSQVPTRPELGQLEYGLAGRGLLNTEQVEIPLGRAGGELVVVLERGPVGVRVAQGVAQLAGQALGHLDVTFLLVPVEEAPASYP
ncbi:hypothetical protein ACFW81_06840 [Streptomyces angustmyceticus]|uniref:hypothetical protein n=1 Tax=Streptomyces angustmyceticus TaxID=285578 RepID=UPI0036D0F1CB